MDLWQIISILLNLSEARGLRLYLGQRSQWYGLMMVSSASRTTTTAADRLVPSRPHGAMMAGQTFGRKGLVLKGSRAGTGGSVVSMQEVRLNATAARSSTWVVRRSHEAGDGVTGVIRATTGRLRMAVSAGMIRTEAGRLSSTKVVE